jgi:hypothetical protein
MLEIFLDQMLACAATGAAHLLDPTFTGALDEREVALAAALRKFVESVPESARAAPAWAVVANALRQLGWQSTPKEEGA